MKRGRRYFLYVGELKARCVCEYLEEALSRLTGHETSCIAVVPDALEAFPYPDVLVINPRAARLSRQRGGRVACRMPSRQFASLVSSSPSVGRLVSRLLARQETLWVYPFESMPELTLAGDPRVRILGPDGGVASRWNDKVFQYRRLRGHVPLAEHRVCFGRAGLLDAMEPMWARWRHGVFVTRPFSAAGAQSFIAASREDLAASVPDEDAPWLAVRFVPHLWDPTVLAIAANPETVLIAGVADQQIVDGRKFRGSKAPTALPPGTVDEIVGLTRTVGRLMALDGYRGFFGCDFIVGPRGKVHFVEVNARKQGTTMEMACCREVSLPEGAPSLAELEVHAVTRSSFPAPVGALEMAQAKVHWGTYNFKVETDVETAAAVPQVEDERAMFRSVSRDRNASARHVVVEHVGARTRVAAGSFLARVVAVGRSRDAVEAELARGRSALAASLAGEGGTDDRGEGV